LPEGQSLTRLLRNDNPKETKGRIIQMRRKDVISASQILHIIDHLEPGTVLAIMSEVRVEKNRILHIPMMDLAQKEDREKLLADAIYFFKHKGYRGAILSSGRSFHFYGVSLIDQREWEEFMGYCGLSELCDGRYIAYQLINGYSSLRVSFCDLRPVLPKVEALIGSPL